MLLQGLWVPRSAIAEPSKLLVLPDGVHIDESFRGEQVIISAEIPKGTSAVVEIKGATHKDHLLRKGRRGGLWMSVGEVTVSGAPSVYLVMTTAGLASQPDTAFQWGYNALEKLTEFGGALPRDGAGALFKEFVKLKESEGFYGVFPDALKVSTSGESATVEGQVTLPSNIAPGNYEVSLSVLNSGKVVDRKFVQFAVDMEGLPALLSTLAHGHALLYGILAVVIAIITGFVMGVVFKSKSAR